MWSRSFYADHQAAQDLKTFKDNTAWVTQWHNFDVILSTLFLIKHCIVSTVLYVILHAKGGPNVHCIIECSTQRPYIVDRILYNYYLTCTINIMDIILPKKLSPAKQVSLGRSKPL